MTGLNESDEAIPYAKIYTQKNCLRKSGRGVSLTNIPLRIYFFTFLSLLSSRLAI